MSSGIGKNVRISIFGESHGEGIGCVLEGVPPGEAVDLDAVAAQMARRAPGRDAAATPRRESDGVEVLSGLWEGRTTGAPLAALIRNGDARPGDYAALARVPRPGHADYTGFVRYGGFADTRGGGHFSGRLTAPLVFAGSVCRQILARRGVVIGSHVLSVGGVSGTPFDGARIDPAALAALSERAFPVRGGDAEAAMRAEIDAARQAGDSVGGVIEAAAAGLPAGLGSPLFGGVENVLAALLFGIPAVKGVEFGDGFALAAMRGSAANDPFVMADGEVRTDGNRHGGVLGGITSGMPLILRVAVKPTPSVAQPQRSVDLHTGEAAALAVRGRHDPCIAARAAAVVEAAVALGLLDLWAST